MNKEDIKKMLIGMVMGVFLAAGVGVWAVWSEPTQAPTGGNPSAPVNVSNTGQTKGGNLVVNANNQYQNGFLVSFGALVIGDPTPETSPGQLKLDVEGKAGATMFCDANGTKCFTVTTLCSKISGLCE
ncbi:MAG TPA: hypothetical protein VJI73_04720 [Candidatus Paceibacterota bacterium]